LDNSKEGEMKRELEMMERSKKEEEIRVALNDNSVDVDVDRLIERRNCKLKIVIGIVIVCVIGFVVVPIILWKN
jgi:hypothetical protein